MALLRGPPIADGRICEVEYDALSARVQQPQLVKGFGISRRSGPRPLLECGRIIRTRIRRPASLHSGIGRASPNVPKPNHGSRIASSIPRITPLSIYMKTE